MLTNCVLDDLVLEVVLSSAIDSEDVSRKEEKTDIFTAAEFTVLRIFGGSMLEDALHDGQGTVLVNPRGGRDEPIPVPLLQFRNIAYGESAKKTG